MIDVLFEKVIHLYFSGWSLWKYVQKHYTEATDIAWNEFLFQHSARTMDNGSYGLNLKTMEMTDGDHIEFRHSDSKIQNTKIQNVWEMALCETFDRKSGITPVSRIIFFWSTFSIWPPMAILNLDVWVRQNTINDTRKKTNIAENEFLVWNLASNMGYMAQNRKKWNW